MDFKSRMYREIMKVCCSPFDLGGVKGTATSLCLSPSFIWIMYMARRCIVHDAWDAWVLQGRMPEAIICTTNVIYMYILLWCALCSGMGLHWEFTLVFNHSVFIICSGRFIYIIMPSGIRKLILMKTLYVIIRL